MKNTNIKAMMPTMAEGLGERFMGDIEIRRGSGNGEDDFLLQGKVSIRLRSYLKIRSQACVMMSALDLSESG